MEQPRDPKEYRPNEDVEQRQYMSMFRTQEWQQFQDMYNFYKVDFDQGPMGHERRKPTTLHTSMESLLQLQGIHGPPEHPPEDLRTKPLQQRIEASKRWATWAPGLKKALAMAIQQHLEVLDQDPLAQGPSSSGLGQRAQPASLRPLKKSPEQTNEPFSVQSLSPYPVQSNANDGDSEMIQQPTTPLSSNQIPTQVRSLGAVALNQWKQHFLQDHLPARRDCAQCIRAQGRSKPHRRVQHPSAFTLSIDLSGKMNEGDDQSERGCKYLMIGCYTFPVTREGASLLPVPGREHEEEDKPLPGLEEEFEEMDHGGDEADQALP